MKKNLLIGTIKILVIAIAFTVFPVITNADNEEMDVEGFEIMPKLTDEQIADINEQIYKIGVEGGHVWENYNAVANSEGFSTAQQISSGIMNRDTIMNYIVFIIKFLSQLGLLVGAGFIMYAGYKYMLTAFGQGKDASSMLKNAIIGVIIVIFSYAIMKILTSIIGLT